MNYAELTQAVQDYLQTDETSFVSNIPLFVRQAEQRLHRLVNIPEFRKNASGSMTAGNRYLARPTDLLSVLSMAVIDSLGVYAYLSPKEMSFIREAYPDPAVQAVPRFYATFDGDNPTLAGNFLIGPTPNQNYAVELQYTADPPSIVDTGTSWLGTNAETALLYGTLLEAYTFLKGDTDLMQVYKTRYDEALALLGVVDTKQRRDAFRDGDRALR